MKRSEIIFLIVSLSIILFISIVQAQDEYYKELEIKVDIKNDISSNSDNLKVNLTSFPKDDLFQKVETEISPKATISDESILFEFNENGDYSILVSSKVKSALRFIMVKFSKEIPLDIPKEYKLYLLPTANINSNNELIRIKAKNIAGNNKNIYEISLDIAKFVKENVEYDLSYAGQNKDSVWVLQNKKGVCSEFTSLFVALCRSLGIPARYVSGVVYSNIEDKFREHAWAEIYDGYQWIPFDPTFGQYGWVDSTHVVLGYLTDPEEASISYSYTGEVDIGKFEIETEIEKYNEKVSPLVEIELNWYKDKVSLDSYAPLIVNVKNPNNFYVNLPLYITQAPDKIEENYKDVLLKPLEEKKVFFLIHIPNSRQCDFGCKSEIVLESAFNDYESIELYFSSMQDKITKEEAEKLIEEESGEKNEGLILMDCKSSKQTIYPYEDVEVNCVISNQKENDEEVLFCLNEDCKELNVEKDSLTSKDFSVKIEEKPIALCAELRDRRGSLIDFSCLSFSISEKPNVEIKNIDVKNVRYGDVVYGNFTFNSNRDIQIVLKISNMEEYEIDLKKGLNVAKIPIKSWKIKDDLIKTEIIYKEESNTYKNSQEFEFVVEDVSFLEKIFAWFKILMFNFRFID